MHRSITWLFILTSISLTTYSYLSAADDKFQVDTGKYKSDISNILQLKSAGEGQVVANESCKKLSAADADCLVPVIFSLEKANPLAENLLRGIAETQCDQLRAHSDMKYNSQITEIIKHTELLPNTRSFAYEILHRLDPKTAEAMIPGFIDDPSDELRRLAVADLIEKGEKIDLTAKPEEAKTIFEKALSSATDDDQVKQIKKPLEKLGVKVDLQKHFGFLNTWHLIGPFDNKDMKGFPVVYAPEETIKLEATMAGQLGDVSWKEYSTDDSYGKLNIAKQLGPFKGAITYAYTTFKYDKEQQVEFRLATPNAWKLWVNGELVFAREEYHRGSFFDQYRIPGKLKAGENTILLKVCQNEQTQEWAQDWDFQFRICDITGRAVHEAK